MQRIPARSVAALACVWLCTGVATAQTATDRMRQRSELDALELATDPSRGDAGAGKSSVARPSRLLLEASVGRYWLRHEPGEQDTHRFSVDWRYSARLSSTWRGVLSDRFDHTKPADVDRNINTLREAYLGWQSEDAANSVEFGRINLRAGVGYGYNPTDFFRDGSLRTATTLDPIALRDARMGSVALRAQRLWSGGGASFVLSPKLDDKPDRDGMSLDLGSTNHSTRAQVGWSHDLAGSVSLQLLAFKQAGEPVRLGANITALLGGSVVAHGEATYGRERDLVDRVFATPGAKERSRSRVATGVTVTLPDSMSLTGEFQYNGFALHRSSWDRLGSSGGPAAQGAYLQESDRLQELPVSRAALVYVSKKNLGVKGLDLTALMRVNVADKSKLLWAELRQSVGNADVALQWQQLSGKPTSELGVLPLRRSLQLVLAYRM